MTIWQADLSRTVREDKANFLTLLISDEGGSLVLEAHCPQSEADLNWLVAQLTPLVQTDAPERVDIFRPQALGLFQQAGARLGMTVQPTRHTEQLKALLQEKNIATAIEQLPPQPLPQDLWGQEWRFAALLAGDLVEYIGDRPLPFLSLPVGFEPLRLGLASSLPIAGVIVYGGRRALALARWLDEMNPMAINYIPTQAGVSGGVILESGLAERWILATFEDREVAEAAAVFQQRQSAAQGLHFLLIQPDDSGMTYTGFWLLKNP